MGFDQLPKEIQLQIFSELPVKTLCTIVTLVCHQWRQLAHDPSIWIDVEINTYPLPAAIQVLQRCSPIRRLKMCNVKNFSWVVDLPKRPFLREIFFVNCMLSENTISQFVTTFPHVQIFNDTAFFPRNYGIVQNIVMWDHLAEISLRENYYGTAFLSAVADNCKNLIRFNVSDLQGETERAFVNFVKLRGCQLQVLSVGGLNHLSSKTYNCLSHCHRLEELTLRGCKNLNNTGLNVIVKLKSLRLLALATSDKLFSRKLPDKLSEMCSQSLEKVTFESCVNLNGDALGRFIKSCPSIKKLEVIDANKLTETDCRLIANEHDFRLSRSLAALILQK